MNGKKKGFIDPNVLVDFFLKKLFEENLIDTDTYVIAKNKAKEDRKNVTTE